MKKNLFIGTVIGLLILIFCYQTKEYIVVKERIDPIGPIDINTWKARIIGRDSIVVFENRFDGKYFKGDELFVMYNDEFEFYYPISDDEFEKSYDSTKFSESEIRQILKIKLIENVPKAKREH